MPEASAQSAVGSPGDLGRSNTKLLPRAQRLSLTWAPLQIVSNQNRGCSAVKLSLYLAKKTTTFGG